jgi:threonine synthase
MHSHLACFNPACRARFDVNDVLYNCPTCGGLLEAQYDFSEIDAPALKKIWRERRMDNAPLSQSGVWRYRELFPFVEDTKHVVTLREGNTPLLNAPRAAEYGGLASITFKHQGFNPTGSFKDNGMTAGVAQARKLGMKRVACVSTGNTSASMAAYASAGGLDPLIFIPHGNISYGKLAQALEYGAKTFQVEANFDQILALVRVLAERLGIYLLNSINPFRIEGQKSIVIEMMDQRDWKVPDWVVLPGGNLGNVSAFGKGLREMKALGFIDKLPRLAVVQAEGSSPFYEYMADVSAGGAGKAAFHPNTHPETLATAIKIGDPVSWPKAQFEIETTNGVVERATEQEIADAKAVIGQCGIGCEPASAATLAGIRRLRAAGIIAPDADVVAVLTGNVLKDPDYIYRYHTGQLEAPGGALIKPTFGNKPVVVPNDADQITRMIG